MTFYKKMFGRHMVCPYCQEKCIVLFKKLLLSPYKEHQCINCGKMIRISNLSISRNAVLICLPLLHPGYPEYYGIFTLVSIAIAFLFFSELFIKIKRVVDRDNEKKDSTGAN